MKALSFLGIICAATVARSDVVLFANGDRYTGQVLLVNQTEVRLTNEVTGALTIPRSKVSSIQFGAPEQMATLPTVPQPKAPASAAVTLDGNAIEQVQKEFLSTANPEANKLFQEMVQGLASGSLNVGDIRQKAQETLAEVKELQKDLGEDDTAGLLNSYVSMLEGFLKSTTNAPAPKGTVKKPQPAEQAGN